MSGPSPKIRHAFQAQKQQEEYCVCGSRERDHQPKRTGPPKGHPGWGGRPKGVTRPCGWCGEPQTAANDRGHWKTCEKRPQ